MNTTYDVDYFLAKFEAIPEEEWCAEHFELKGKRCANGHCGISTETRGTEESKALAVIFSILRVFHKTGFKTYGVLLSYSTEYSTIAAVINDGATLQYPQPTPKQRILGALMDIKANQAVAQAQEIIKEGRPEQVLSV